MMIASRRRFTSAAAALAAAWLTGAAASPASTPASGAVAVGADAAPAGGASFGGAPAAMARDTATEVGWRMLAGLNYRTGEKTEELAALDGEIVRVPGFTVPLEDFASTATEFLLVPFVGACVHVPPPPPNQLVFIEMDGGKRAKMDGWNPVWVEGILRIEATESIYGSAGYTITGHRVFPYDS